MGRFQWREINFNDYGSQHTNPISNISQTRFDSGNCIFSFGLKPIVIFCWFTCASLKNLYEIPRRGGLVWKLSRGYAFLKFTIDSLFQIEFQSQAYSQQLFQLLWHILHFGQFWCSFFSLYAYFLIACCLLWPWSNSWLWRIFNPFICSLHYSTAANSGFTVVTNRDTFMMIVNFLLLQVQVVSNKLQLSAIPCTMEWRFGGQFEPPYRIQARYFSCYLRNII